MRLLPLLLVLGCASVQDALDEKAYGTSEVYEVKEEDAWKIARRVLRWEGADAIEEERDYDVMVTSTAGDTGTVMACWIEPVDAEHTKVTIVTKRRYQLSLFTALTEGTFQARFKQALAMLRGQDDVVLAVGDRGDQSRSLPLKAPPYEWAQ